MANSDKTTTKSVGGTIYSAAGMVEARAALKPCWAAIPDDEVGRGPVVPVVEAVILARTVYERAVEDLPRFDKVFKAFGPTQIDDLDRAARGLLACDLEYRNARHGQDEAVEQLLQRAVESRRVLLGALDLALGDDVAVAERLSEIRRGQGKTDLAQDLLDLVALARDNYQALDQLMRISPEQLQRTEALADHLLDALAFSSTDSYQELVDERRRAWAYFYACYQTVAIHGRFLDYGPVGDARYPSLFTLRSTKRRPTATRKTSEGAQPSDASEMVPASDEVTDEPDADGESPA